MIRFVPTPESRRQLDEFLDRLENIPRRMAAQDEPIRAAIRRGFLLNFERESAGNGPGWAALAEATNDERQRLGYPREHPILVRSGSYKASFVDANAEGHVEAVVLAVAVAAGDAAARRCDLMLTDGFRPAVVRQLAQTGMGRSVEARRQRERG